MERWAENRPATEGDDSIRPFNRINHRIRVPQVRCVGPDGKMLGVMTTSEAIRLAINSGQDLVEISPNADPPVCRIMDYGKFMYEESRKRKEAKKHQHNLSVKEIKFHANVGDHDYQTKVKHIRGFLEDGHKVKISLAFRGRENAHRELGFEVVKRVLNDCADMSMVEAAPKLIGRAIFAMLAYKAGGRHVDEPAKSQDRPKPAPVSQPAANQTSAPVQPPQSTPSAVQPAPVSAPPQNAAK